MLFRGCGGCSGFHFIDYSDYLELNWILQLSIFFWVLLWYIIIQVTIYFVCTCLQDLESDEAKAFTKAAAQNDEIMFGICSDAELMKEFEIEKEGMQ